MALIGNYAIHNKTPGRSFGGVTTIANGGTVHSRANFNNSSSSRARFFGSQSTSFDKTAAQPNGYAPPYSFVIAQKSGGMSSYTQSNESISSTSANMAGGRNLALTGAAMSISVTNAQLDQIVSFIASASLNLSVSSAALVAAAQAVASAVLTMTLTNAQAGAIFSVLASANGAASANATLTALGFMEAEAGGATPLSPEGLASSLLDNEDIETGYSMRESLRLILSALVGKLSGAATTEVTIRDINDTVSRIVATVDTNGNRSAVTKDVS